MAGHTYIISTVKLNLYCRLATDLRKLTQVRKTLHCNSIVSKLCLFSQINQLRKFLSSILFLGVLTPENFRIESYLENLSEGEGIEPRTSQSGSDSLDHYTIKATIYCNTSCHKGRDYFLISKVFSENISSIVLQEIDLALHGEDFPLLE